MASSKTKIAVLGGGPASLTAVYWLTSDPALRDRYDITVYQMGWRLGGKGASGRGPYGRIEEHGLHLLFGFYENFFHMVRACYHEVNRPVGHPLRTWRQAFHPRDFAVEEDYVLGAWHPWLIAFPGNGAVPGSGGALPRLRDYLMMGVQLFAGLLFGWRASYRMTRALYPRGADWERAQDPPLGGRSPLTTVIFARLLFWMLVVASHLAIVLRRWAPWLGRAWSRLRGAVWPAIKRLASRNVRAHRFWYDLDNTFAFFGGIIADGVLLPGGFDRIDDLDYREWLVKHGIHRETLATPLVRTIYDAAFSYENGDPNRQRMAAGTAVRALLRAAWTYKGAGYYRMMAGMGDVVFGPLYLVLKRRGVKFEFFHKVESLHIAEDGESIGRIRIDRQVELAEGVTEYDPLVTIKGLECWPSQPRWEQVRDAERYADIDLESYYSGGRGREVELQAGRDFDRIIFGIPIGGVRFVCRELIDNPRKPRWKAMSEQVQSVQTVSFQLWMTEELGQLGWKYPEPLLSLFVEPLNTWSGMTQLVPVEDWPPELNVRDISYFTGAQPGPTHPPALEERDFPRRMKQRAKDEALRFLRGDAKNPADDPAIGGIGNLMPGAIDAGDPPCIDWNLLADANEGRGEARFDSQYWRSNCGPSERCTLALPGTNRYRMKAGDTGYSNLFVSGDWTDNNLYCAFMEATVQSGILTARAVSGRDFPIIGEALNFL